LDIHSLLIFIITYSLLIFFIYFIQYLYYHLLSIFIYSYSLILPHLLLTSIIITFIHIIIQLKKNINTLLLSNL